MPAEIVVKMCGFTRAEDAHFAAALNVWGIGVIFVPGTPRFVEPKIAHEWLSDIPAGVKKIGVFRDQSVDDIRRVLDVVKLDLIQLHGDESPADVKALGAERVIKTITLLPAVSATAKLPALPVNYGAEYLLVDKPKDAPSGETIDVRAAAKVLAVHPKTLIAGGLDAGNVGEIIRAVKPWGVDVAAGIEVPDEPGVKDADRMRAFVDAVRQAAAKLESK